MVIVETALNPKVDELSHYFGFVNISQYFKQIKKSDRAEYVSNKFICASIQFPVKYKISSFTDKSQELLFYHLTFEHTQKKDTIRVYSS
jgi:hypothetical protein